VTIPPGLYIYMSFEVFEGLEGLEGLEGFGFCKVDVVVGVAEPLRAKSWS